MRMTRAERKASHAVELRVYMRIRSVMPIGRSYIASSKAQPIPTASAHISNMAMLDVEGW
jgi:hypothetical protein